MLESSYPFLFIMNKDEVGAGFLRLRLYKFKSTKSKLTYIVRVEVYEHHIYAVKFYLKKMQNSPKKYQYATNTYEPRRIVNTCINIMLSIYKEDAMSSFGFLGARGAKEESTYCTKRYRLYSKLMATYFSDDKFLHKENKEKSAYLLVNKLTLEKEPTLIEDIEKFFVTMYDYFD